MLRRVGRCCAVLIAAAVALLAPAAPASAHVELVSSDPAHGSVVEGPIEEIVFDFSTDARPAGDGFVLFDEDGTVLVSTAIVLSEVQVRVEPAENLNSGRYAVTWSMQAGDAHPATGGIEFRVHTTAQGATEPAPAPEFPASADSSDPVEAVSAPAEPSLLDTAVSSSSTAAGDALGVAARAITILATVLAISPVVMGWQEWTEPPSTQLDPDAER